MLAVFGPECLRRASWKRHFHRDADNWFVAEPLLSAYHLIVVFTSEYAGDAELTAVLDDARPALEEIIAGLPPLDGGGRAVGAERSG